MKSDFFNSNNYFIDEKVNLFKFENVYNVFNDKGEQVGAVKQILTGGQKMLRLLLNKAMLPFKLNIIDKNDQVQATISRGWTIFMSKITVSDANGTPQATIKQKFKLFSPTFKIYNMSEQQIAEISGDWKAWNFIIKDENGMQIGTISKKWAGAMKEIFTTADKYNVFIDSGYSKTENKLAIISSAITIDMVLKESK